MRQRRILLALTIAVTLASGVGTLSAAALSVPDGAVAPAIVVTGNEPWALVGLVPGDALPEREVRIAATGCVRYWLAPSLDGDDALSGWIEVRATSRADGAALTAGRVRDLASAGEPTTRTLCDGEAVVRLTASLRRDAPNEVQGAAASLTWTVYAVELAASDR